MATSALPAAAGATSASRTSAWRARASFLWRASILPLAIVAVWSAVTDSGLIPKYILPSPGQVVAAAWDFMIGGNSAQAYSGAFLAHFWASLKRVMGGFALGAGLAIPLGIVLGHNRRLAVYIEPTLQLTR